MTTYTYDSHRPPVAQVTAGLTSKAAKIRTLFRAGYSRREIGEHLGISPQYVYKVLTTPTRTWTPTREPQLRPRPEGDSDASERGSSATTRQVAEITAYGQDDELEQARIVIGPAGRVVIPAAFRRALGVEPGDAVSIRMENDELRMVSFDTETRRLREPLARYVPEGVSVVDELLKERRREVAAEEAAVAQIKARQEQAETSKVKDPE